ncbi:hypothetical protein SAMN04244579_01292 [Azotobacter beijerinckii]|uniref:Heme-degrading monooxygenase HmoA n=1 Tax=Azotobacter beijerinckii TaxID=170623 RepID=A0A1H6RZH9_9GAMM|nr:hypothetical protein SAMN04244579_01292 [Azotobacter beijerinckii]
MSTDPVTLMVARRVTCGRYRAFSDWLDEGRRLAADFDGFLGSGVLAPPPGDDEYQIIFRFSDESTLVVWEHSASRHAWLARGRGLFDAPHAAGWATGSTMPWVTARRVGSRPRPSGWLSSPSP